MAGRKGPKDCCEYFAIHNANSAPSFGSWHNKEEEENSHLKLKREYSAIDKCRATFLLADIIISQDPSAVWRWKDDFEYTEGRKRFLETKQTEMMR
jgi:hypothetical protein